jgi:hypothetical protein
MAKSFLKYRWKESLLWVLLQLMPELTVELEPDKVGDAQHFPVAGVPDIPSFLRFLDDSGAIPVASNPHSIFIFSSLQNFVAAVHDTVNANWVLAGHIAVSVILG